MQKSNIEIMQTALEEEGYIVIENLLDQGKCQFYKDLLEKHHNDFSDRYVKNNTSDHELAKKAGEKVVYNLHNKDLSWLSLIDHQQVLDVISKPLMQGSYKDSEPFYLYNNSARNPLKGGGFQQLHTDSNLPGCNYEMVLNVLWAFDDMNHDNGSTRLIPGSHKWKSYPADGVQDEREIMISLNKGSVLIFSGAIWHGGGLNKSGLDRWALLLGYSRWFFKPSFDYMQNTPIEMFNQYTDRQKSLLGFNLTSPKDEFTRLSRKSSSYDLPQV